MPPSADDLPGRGPVSRQQRQAAERVARKRGKQPGAPGMAMAWAVADMVDDHHPAGACECGADLACAEDLGVARSYQELEIPGPAARRIQHDLHRARCGCGREHVAPRPLGVPEAAVSIGPNLRALAVCLLVFQHVPAEMLASAPGDLSRLTCPSAYSAGFSSSTRIPPPSPASSASST